MARRSTFSKAARRLAQTSRIPCHIREPTPDARVEQWRLRPRPIQRRHATVGGHGVDKFWTDALEARDSTNTRPGKRGPQSVEAVDALRERWGRGEAPDVKAYNVCIKACGDAGRWEAALDVFGEMKRAGIRLNVNTYAAAIAACGTGGQGKAAIELLREMETAGSAPTATVRRYNAAIAACGAGGEWQLARGLLEELVDRGLTPDLSSYNACILACERGRRPAEAVELLREVVAERELAPNSVTYDACISACGKGGDWAMAVDLLREMEEGKGLTPNAGSFGAAIEACARRGQAEVAVALLADMLRDSIKPRAATFNAVISALRTGRSRGVAERR